MPRRSIAVPCRRSVVVPCLLSLAAGAACGPTADPAPEGAGRDAEGGSASVPPRHAADDVVLGADLSYVNQILDHGGTYADEEGERSPYAIVADHGFNTVRLRLWHDPSWVRNEVYGDADAPLYSGLDDVARAMAASREQGLAVLLDLHYSDLWADPSRQNPPAAWAGIRSLEVLEDSVHAYTRGVLQALAARGLLPEMVQVGNETNCGILSTPADPGFPRVSTCEGRWTEQGRLLNAGIRAVREVSESIQVVLHVAQPENVAPWFDGITTVGGVTDFDVVGFSYYDNWSDEPLSSIAGHVEAWRAAYGAEVLMVETAYPWTLENADGYANILGGGALHPEFEASPEGQRDYMTALTEQVLAGGGRGVIYWEPAWITSEMKDLWGVGSSWENATLFDFDGRAHEGMSFASHPYAVGGGDR